MKEILLKEFRHIYKYLSNKGKNGIFLNNCKEMDKLLKYGLECTLNLYEEKIKHIINNSNEKYDETKLNWLLDDINYLMIRGQIRIHDDDTTYLHIIIEGITRIGKKSYYYLSKIDQKHYIGYLTMMNCFLTEFHMPTCSKLASFIIFKVDIDNVVSLPYNEILIEALNKTYAKCGIRYYVKIRDQLKSKMQKYFPLNFILYDTQDFIINGTQDLIESERKYYKSTSTQDLFTTSYNSKKQTNTFQLNELPSNSNLNVRQNAYYNCEVSNSSSSASLTTATTTTTTTTDNSHEDALPGCCIIQ